LAKREDEFLRLKVAGILECGVTGSLEADRFARLTSPIVG
jgi:hypothetical protein